MSGGLVFLVIAGLLLLLLPRRSAALPLLLAAAYTPRTPLLDIGPASLSVLRILVLIGILRVILRGEGLPNGLNAIDRLLIAWAALLIGMSVFHTDAWVFRFGQVWSEMGVYVLCRMFIQNAEDVRRVFRFLCVALVPLAVLMLLEKHIGQNFFALVGGSAEAIVRDDRVRAYGPFAHAILAGGVGATCLPLAVAVWKGHRLRALTGLLSGVAILYASTSTGPILTAVFICIGLAMWTLRSSMRAVRWGALTAIVGLDLVMKDPVYFLMARIDFTGSSASWHRAQLIRSAIQHLDEWWLVGTDYTRHWMASGIHANDRHTDITNHFLGVGVSGGLPLLLLFVLVLVAAFRAVGAAMRQSDSVDKQFLAWALGALLFGHVITFWGISVFDQSMTFFYLALAGVGALRSPVDVRGDERTGEISALAGVRRLAQRQLRHAPAAALALRPGAWARNRSRSAERRAHIGMLRPRLVDVSNCNNVLKAVIR